MITFPTGVPFPPVIESEEKEISLPHFNLSWNPAVNKSVCPLTMYTVYYKAIGSQDEEHVQYHINTTAVVTTLPLDCDTEYEFAVSAWNEFRESKRSQSWQVKVITGISVSYLFLFNAITISGYYIYGEHAAG